MLNHSKRLLLVLALVATLFVPMQRVRAGIIPIGGDQCMETSSGEIKPCNDFRSSSSAQSADPAPDAGDGSPTLTDILMLVIQDIPRLL
jgi:hypothetical protein